MQNIVFYVDASKTLGTVTNITNNRNEFAPHLVFGVSVCLRMRLFESSETTDAYPISSFSDVTHWAWRMDSNFNRTSPYKVNADNENISVQTATETVNGKTMSFTEIVIPISNMNTVELADWLGNNKEQTQLTGELVGYDSSGNAIFGLQVDGFVMRNSLADLNEPTSNDQGYLTSSETENLISSAVMTKQDKLTSANAGAGIAINSGGTISMACVILGATNGVKIADSKVQFDPETAIGANGSSRGAIVTVADGLQVTGGTASIDDATVQDVLVGIEGGTASINDEVVTPGNLRGALSVGQAVDVSCPPAVRENWQLLSTDGGQTWTTMTKEAMDGAFLMPFSIKTIADSIKTTRFGWTVVAPFPKFANGLIYLYMMDIKASQACSMTYYDGTVLKSKSIPASDEYVRTYVVTNTGSIWIEKVVAANTTFQLDIKNWRQYEVTALTDEAIAYIAQLDNPDAFFRSNTIFQVRDKYLVKQDMVCPWIYTIGMPDNSDLTVAAGLSYKIRYTNDSPHKITVDTIPADAYGWDAHIQMFIKGTSSIVFQKPLILMDALTPNAGHNLSVKFRNGQALVYVDDLNAGYVVVSTTGSTDGTLAYGFTDAAVEYIVFGSTTNGAVCDFGTVTAVYGTTVTDINLIGNGPDQTFISGDLTVPSGKFVNMQDLALSDVALLGGGTVTTANVAIPAGSTISKSSATTLRVKSLMLDGELQLDTATVTGSVYIADSSFVISGTGTIKVNGTGIATNVDCTYTGITFTGATASYGFAVRGNDAVGRLVNCIMRDNTVRPCTVTGATLYLTGCTVSGNTSASTHGMGTNATGESVVFIDNCLYVDNAGASDIFLGGTSKISIAGSTVHGDIFNNSDVFDAIVISGSTVIKAALANGTNGGGHVLTDFTFVRQDDVVATIDGCVVTTLSTAGVLKNTRGDITVPDAMDLWQTGNFTFGTPLDLSNVNTAQFSDTNLTSACQVKNATRIQIAEGATVNFSGNSLSSDTKILQAPVMLVGSNAASPSGSAFVGGATVSGIGTWIDKEGDNDFRPVTSNFNVSNTASSGAGSLLDRLTSASAQATTSGMQQFVGFVSGGTQGVASFGAATDIVSTTILTKDYQPVFGGNYTVSSGGVMTVDQATKTTTIAGAAMVMSSVNIPSGATVKVSGGGLMIESMNGAGGTIELAGSNAFQMTGGTIGRVVISSGAIVNLTSSIVPGKSIVLYGGASLSPTTLVCGGSSRIFEDVEIRGTTITDQGLIYGATVYSDVGDDHYYYYTEDDGETSNSVIITGATEYVVPGGLVRIVGT